MALVCGGRNYSMEYVLSFFLWVGCEDQTQVAKLERQKRLCLLSFLINAASYLFDLRFLTESRAHQFGRTDWSMISGASCLCRPLPQHWDSRCVPHHQAYIYMGARNPNSGLCAYETGQALYQLSHLPGPDMMLSIINGNLL